MDNIKNITTDFIIKEVHKYPIIFQNLLFNIDNHFCVNWITDTKDTNVFKFDKNRKLILLKSLNKYGDGYAYTPLDSITDVYTGIIKFHNFINEGLCFGLKGDTFAYMFEKINGNTYGPIIGFHKKFELLPICEFYLHDKIVSKGTFKKYLKKQRTIFKEQQLLIRDVEKIVIDYLNIFYFH